MTVSELWTLARHVFFVEHDFHGAGASTVVAPSRAAGSGRQDGLAEESREGY